MTEQVPIPVVEGDVQNVVAPVVELDFGRAQNTHIPRPHLVICSIYDGLI